MQRCIPSDVVIRVCASDYSTSLTARDFTREGSVKTRSRVRRAAIAALAVPAVLIFAGCTSSVAGPSDSSSASSTPTSPPSSSSPPMSPSASVTSSSAASTGTPTSANPWPANLTPDQVTQAQAALSAYRAYWALVDQAVAAPGSDWTQQVSQYATGNERDSFLKALAEAAARGQYGSGETGISPEVTAVEPGLITISDCVDKTDTDYLQNGTSIKAPNAAGSYFRHPAVVQVAEFTGGSWLVLSTADDWTKTC